MPGCPIQFQCTGCHKNGFHVRGTLSPMPWQDLRKSQQEVRELRLLHFHVGLLTPDLIQKQELRPLRFQTLWGCVRSQVLPCSCVWIHFCAFIRLIWSTFHCLLSLSSEMYGQQTVDSGQQMPGSSCVRLTALLKNVWRRSLRFMLSRCSRKGSIYQMRQPYLNPFLHSLDLLNHRHHSGPVLALWTWISRFVAVVYGCICSQSFQWLSQSRACRLQLHPERSCQAKDASRTLQFLGKDEFLTLCSLEVQVATPVTQNFMHPKLPASLLQVGWGIWMASERSGQVELVSQSTSAKKFLRRRTLTCTYSSERRTWRGRV